MKIPIYQIDSFTQELFRGNPASVCPLDDWYEDSVLQKIANENNQSETAFFLCKNGKYEIRWFTPQTEVDLCGHATLAAGFVLFNCLGLRKHEVTFNSRSGPLQVIQKNDFLTLDLPSDPPVEAELPDIVRSSFNIQPKRVLKGKTDYLLLYKKEEDIINLNPNFNLLRRGEGFRGVIVTATGNKTDFVSRFFAPSVGINEDSVTGSAHTTLTPFWSGETGEDRLVAQQLSQRGGILTCELKGKRVILGGRARLYMAGYIYHE